MLNFKLESQLSDSCSIACIANILFIVSQQLRYLHFVKILSSDGINIWNISGFVHQLTKRLFLYHINTFLILYIRCIYVSKLFRHSAFQRAWQLINLLYKIEWLEFEDFDVKCA